MSPTVTNAWEFGGPLARLPQEQAWWIVFGALALCVLLAWLSYRFAVVALGWPKRTVLVILRATFFAALLACLANPVRIERTTAEPPAPPEAQKKNGPTGKLAVIVDRSDSMTSADNRGRTRLDDALATWRRFEPAARPVYADVQHFSFAGDLKPAASLDEAIARKDNTAESHLYESIAALLKKPKEERPEAIVVLTDGVDNSGENESLAREAAIAAGVPLHFVAGTNRERPEPFLRVREWNAPTVVMHHTEFLVETSFEAFSREDRTIPFSLWRGDVRLESGTLALTTGANLVPWSFRVTAGEPGSLELSLKFDEGAASHVVARSVSSVLANRPIKVLLYHGALDWGFRYFTDAMRTDPSFQLTAIANPLLAKLDMVGPRPADAVKGQLPTDPAKLAPFDCVVLARMSKLSMDEARQKALVEFARGGGAVIFTDPALIGDFRGNDPLLQLLPVVMDADDRAAGLEAVRRSGGPIARSRRGSGDPVQLLPFALTETGRASPVFAKASGGAGANLIPKFAEYLQVSRIRPGAEILAVHPTARDPKTGQPHILLATQSFGKGRTAIVTSDGLWRWKLSEPSDSNVVATFWQQLVLAMGRRAEREHLHFVNTPAQVKVGEAVSLRLGGVDASQTPEVVARMPDGHGLKFSMTPTGDPAAPWRINWKPSLPGAWEFAAGVEGDYRAFFFTTAVAEQTGELAHTPPAVDSLRALAAATGGLLLTDKPPLAWRSSEARAAQEKKPEPIIAEKRHLRWNTWTVLGIAFGAFALEMILRRVWKLL